VSRKIVEKSSLLAKKSEERIEIEVGDDEILVVYVKPLTFLDLQYVVENVVDVGGDNASFNIGKFFDYALSNWIIRTEPDLTVDDIKALPAEIGQKIIMALPSLEDIGEALSSGFRN